MDNICLDGVKNTGTPCTTIAKVTNRFITLNTYDSAGNLNEIDLTAGPFDKAYFDARYNDVDPTTRWRPWAPMKNIKDMRNDPEFKTWDDNTKSFIQQGVRSVEGFIIGQDAPPQLVGKIESTRGIPTSIFAIDKKGNLIGKRGSDSTHFAPVQIEADSIYAIYNKTVDKDINMIKAGFDVANTEFDEDLWIITANIGGLSGLTYNLNLSRGLIDATSENSAISTTSVRIKLLTDGGDALNPVLVYGLVAADFVSSDSGTTAKIYNATDAADVTITTAESPAGTYTLTFSAQTTADVLIPFMLKSGFDFTQVKLNPVVIP